LEELKETKRKKKELKEQQEREKKLKEEQAIIDKEVVIIYSSGLADAYKCKLHLSQTFCSKHTERR
jgi:hypothetical protein